MLTFRYRDKTFWVSAIGAVDAGSSFKLIVEGVHQWALLRGKPLFDSFDGKSSTQKSKWRLMRFGLYMLFTAEFWGVYFHARNKGMVINWESLTGECAVYFIAPMMINGPVDMTKP